MPYVDPKTFLDLAQLRRQAATLTAVGVAIADGPARLRVIGSARMLAMKADELEAGGCDACRAANPTMPEMMSLCAACPCSDQRETCRR